MNAWKPLIVCGLSDPDAAAALKEACQFKHIIILINNLISDAVLLSTFVVIGVFMYHGIKLITSQGNPGAMTDAKKGIMNVVKGYVVILAAWIVVYSIMNVLVGPAYSLLGQPSA